MKNRRKNICVVRHGYYPSDTRVFKEVRALVEAGYAVDVLCLREDKEPVREVVENVHVYRMLHNHRRGTIARYVFEYGLSILLMSSQLSLLAFTRRYRCVQVNTLPDALVFITLIPRLLGARILLDMHEPTPELLLTKYAGNVSDCMLRVQMIIECLAIRYAHRVITVNDTIRMRFIERGADAEKIGVVRNVPPDDFGATVRPHPSGSDELVLMTHGTLQPRYGQSVLMHALPRIKKEFDRVRLVVAGSGETLEELQALAHELKCDSFTTFTGQVSREEIAELIVQADIGIVPLLPGPFSELCQPNKLFEYIALNVPVVVVRLPAIEESFDDSCLQYFLPGDAGDLADSIIKLGKNPALRQSLAKNAHERYQTLRWKNSKAQYLRIVNELIDSKPKKNRNRKKKIKTE